MKLILKNPKMNLFAKNTIINKKKGENIYISSSIGAGRTLILIALYQQLFSQKHIDKSSILIHTEGDTSSYLAYRDFLDHNQKLENHQLFNLIYKEDKELFFKINFNIPNTTTNFKDKHLFFLLPALNKSDCFVQQIYLKKVYEFLLNLPINNNKNEIPIFFDLSNLMDVKSLNEYFKIVENLNNKGYFFINSTYGINELQKPKEMLKILQNKNKHIFIFKQENTIKKYGFVFDNLDYVNMNSLERMEYHYYVGSILQNKNKTYLTNFNYISTTNSFKNKKLNNILVSAKINNF
jgi:hypothetical protein